MLRSPQNMRAWTLVMMVKHKVINSMNNLPLPAKYAVAINQLDTPFGRLPCQQMEAQPCDL